MDRDNDWRDRDKKWWIAYITIILSFILLFVYHSIANERMESLDRALYHAEALQEEIERSNIKEQEVILRKIRFITERIKEEMIGNPTSVTESKRIK